MAPRGEGDVAIGGAAGRAKKAMPAASRHPPSSESEITMTRTSLSLVLGLGVMLAPAAAFAFDPGFTVGRQVELSLTTPCAARSPGCRADGYPDARYARPMAEGYGPQVYSYNDPRYLAPSMPVQSGYVVRTY